MIRLTTALLTLGVGIPFATTAIAKGKASAGGLVATPRRPFVEFNADLTMFGANGKLLMPVPTPGSDCTVDTQSTIRAVPADERDSWRETAPGEMKCDAASAKQLRTPIAGCGVGSAGWERIRADVARIVFSDAKTTKTTDAGTKKYQQELDDSYKAASKKIPDQKANDPWAEIRPAPSVSPSKKKQQ